MTVLSFLLGLYLVIGLLFATWAVLMLTDLQRERDQPFTWRDVGDLAAIFAIALLIWPLPVFDRWADWLRRGD